LRLPRNDIDEDVSWLGTGSATGGEGPSSPLARPVGFIWPKGGFMTRWVDAAKATYEDWRRTVLLVFDLHAAAWAELSPAERLKHVMHEMEGTSPLVIRGGEAEIG
jgi:hypothetical protein